MRALAIAVAGLAGACTAPASTVTGTIGGVSFRSTHVSYGGTVTAEPLPVPRTTLSFHDFDYCAVADRPAAWPTPLHEVAFDFTNLTAGTFAIGTSDAPGSGIDGDATGFWRIDNDSGNFTGGTIVVTRASASEIEGKLEVTSPNGDYAAGSFVASSCATAGAL